MRIKRSIIFFACLSIVLLFSGCTTQEAKKDNKKEKGTAIYYTDMDCTKLEREVREVDRKSNSQQDVEALLKEMSKVPNNKKYRLALSENVIINMVVVTNNMVEIDFSTGYKKLAANEDLLCRAAIVYTLTQNKEINYVSFYISGKAMMDTDGKVIGAMNRDNFMFGNLPME